jgi:hypothetical protein
LDLAATSAKNEYHQLWISLISKNKGTSYFGIIWREEHIYGSRKKSSGARRIRNDRKELWGRKYMTGDISLRREAFIREAT